MDCCPGFTGKEVRHALNPVGSARSGLGKADRVGPAHSPAAEGLTPGSPGTGSHLIGSYFCHVLMSILSFSILTD